MMNLTKLITSAICLLVVSFLIASTPKVVTYRTQTDFKKGEPKGVSINHIGEISLAPAVREVFNSELAFIWAAVADQQGHVYAAGGNGGQVFKIDSKGNSSVIFEAPEVEVYALAIDRRNNLYVASSPDGKIYKASGDSKIDPATAVFFDPEEIYIWSMVVDNAGNLFVATGEKGNVYKVDTNGNGTLFYEGGDRHIRKLTLDRQGNILAGTSDKGMVVRIDPKGQAFVLYDSPLVEITDLLPMPDGSVYASAVGESALPTQPRPAAPAAGDGDRAGETEAMDLSVQQISGGSGASSKKKTALYRITEDGTVTSYWADQKDRILAMALDGSNLILGAGGGGRLYAMNNDGEVTLLRDLEETDITVLGQSAGGQLMLASSNPGKLYRIEEGLNRSGDYFSDVIDAKVSSQWGAISWEALAARNADVTFYSRSGNTEEPDKTWSPWSQSYGNSDGEAITSPPARFLQLKAAFTSKDGKQTAVLRQFSFSYLQKNVAPQVAHISLHPPGDYYPEAANQSGNNSHLQNGNGRSSQSIGRKTYKQGYRSVSWSANDDNGDHLLFNLFYRGDNERTWKNLAEDLNASVYSWDSELLPDGRFFIKIETSDAPSNPPAMALSSEKVSQPFVVDNSGPIVSELTVRRSGQETIISFSAQDGWTNLQAVEYGLNADKWTLVYPKDGICDSKKEDFEIRITNAEKGTNTIVIKAKDALGNIGFGKSNFKL